MELRCVARAYVLTCPPESPALQSPPPGSTAFASPGCLSLHPPPRLQEMGGWESLSRPSGAQVGGEATVWFRGSEMTAANYRKDRM